MEVVSLSGYVTVSFLNMLLEGNPDSDSILRNPGLSPCMLCYQRLGHQPLRTQCLPPAVPCPARWQSSRTKLWPRARSRPSCSAPYRTKLPRWRWNGWAPRSVCQAGVKRRQGFLPTLPAQPYRGDPSPPGIFAGPAARAEPRSGGPAPEAAARSHSRGAAEAGGQLCQQVSETEGAWSSCFPSFPTPWSLRAQASGTGKLAVGGCRARSF